MIEQSDIHLLFAFGRNNRETNAFLRTKLVYWIHFLFSTFFCISHFLLPSSFEIKFFLTFRKLLKSTYDKNFPRDQLFCNKTNIFWFESCFDFTNSFFCSKTFEIDEFFERFSKLAMFLGFQFDSTFSAIQVS